MRAPVRSKSRIWGTSLYGFLEWAKASDQREDHSSSQPSSMCVKIQGNRGKKGRERVGRWFTLYGEKVE